MAKVGGWRSDGGALSVLAAAYTGLLMPLLIAYPDYPRIIHLERFYLSSLPFSACLDDGLGSFNVSLVKCPNADKVTRRKIT